MVYTICQLGEVVNRGFIEVDSLMKIGEGKMLKVAPIWVLLQVHDLEFFHGFLGNRDDKDSMHDILAVCKLCMHYVHLSVQLRRELFWSTSSNNEIISYYDKCRKKMPFFLRQLRPLFVII